jgi:hypothetical protein
MLVSSKNKLVCVVLVCALAVPLAAQDGDSGVGTTT